MKAIVCSGKGGVETLALKDMPKPELRPHDILVELKAMACNPVDVKNREADFFGVGDRILGYDGAGIVKEIGAEAKGFKVGDEVMFAGDITRSGTLAELIAVDARICALKPPSYDFASASCLPLVSLTAWELLFENLRLPADGSGKDLVFMMVNGAGGVGSAAIQLAKHVLGSATVIATASRPETEKWCKEMGATHVINHHKNFEEELKRIGVEKVDVCFVGVDLDKVYDKLVPVMNLGGAIGAITIDDASKIDVSKLFMPMRLTLSFEFMFGRPMFQNKAEKQGEILKAVAALAEEGKFKSIANTKLQKLTVESVAESHKLQGSGKQIGKIAVEF